MTTTAKTPPSPRSARDPLGDRMKAYEAQSRVVLAPRSWTVIRLDGRSFHTWTRGLERPYSLRMVDAMADVMRQMCEQVPGAVCAYQQSDELTIVTQNFARPGTEPWFGGQVQKIVSVSASMMSALFARHFPDHAPATFDARAFTLPGRVEVANALLWRFSDARRNAINAVAGAHFSARELHGVPTSRRLEMVAEAGVAVERLDRRFMVGQLARPLERLRTSYVDRRTGETVALSEPAISCEWVVEAAPELNARPEGILLSELLLADPVVASS